MAKNVLIGVLVIVLAFLVWNKASNQPEAYSADQIGSTAPDTATASTTADQETPTPVKTATGAVAYPKSTKANVFLVYYTSTGFTPSSLEVKPGSTIRFINTSTKAMRINTTDTIARKPSDEIAQSTSVAKGGTYSITLNVPFTYGYTNQNDPKDKGVIVVR